MRRTTLRRLENFGIAEPPARPHEVAVMIALFPALYGLAMAGAYLASGSSTLWVWLPGTAIILLAAAVASHLAPKGIDGVGTQIGARPH